MGRKSKGKGNREKGSQSAGARKSLSPNAATNKSTQSIKSRYKLPPRNVCKASDIGPWFIDDRGSSSETDKRNRYMRKLKGQPFEFSYQHRKSDAHPERFIQETRYIVAANNKVRQTLIERSHGIPWVAVHGVDTICAVYTQDISELHRIYDFLKQGLAISVCGRYLISQMEDLADSEDLAGKPFAVVSVNSFSNKASVPDEDKAAGFLQGKLKTDSAIADHETIQAHVPDKDMAIGFLMRKLETNSGISHNETIQIAIGAFLELYKQEIKAELIKVIFFEDGIVWYLPDSDVKSRITAFKQQQSTSQ